MSKHLRSAPSARRALFYGLALLAPTLARAENALPRPDFLQAQPAAVELNWTPLKLPTQERIALLGASYMVAMNQDWGIGPSFYGAAKGDYGGIFTVGFTGQRRWRLGRNVHAAASLYAGGGGGLSSPQVSFGGGLMLRPELSLRTESGNWYSGVSLAHTRFPSGNVSGTSVGLVIGYSDGFLSYAPDDVGRQVSTTRRSGMGFDEVQASVGSYRPRSGSKGRDGRPSSNLGKAGGALRQYVSEGAWWGIEAAGASSGGADGYMEVLAGLGQDYALGHPSLRLGWSAAAGLGGGGNVDTGNGWLAKVGPTLRWKTPVGISLNLDAGVMAAPAGEFKAHYVRFALGLPLDQALGSFGQPNDAGGSVQTQTIYASLQRLSQVRFKNGRERNIGHIAMTMTRDIGPHLYGVAQAGSAAFGSAGAYSFGLVGLGLQSEPRGGWRYGAEVLGGAAGGGGVAISGGAAMQGEAWVQREFGSQDRLRLRAGLGQWRSLRGQTQSAPLLHVALGYAFGAVTR